MTIFTLKIHFYIYKLFYPGKFTTFQKDKYTYFIKNILDKLKI